MEWKRYENHINQKLTIQVNGYRICMVKQSTKVALINFSVHSKETETHIPPKIKLKEQYNEVNMDFFKQRIEQLERLKNSYSRNDKNCNEAVFPTVFQSKNNVASDKKYPAKTTSISVPKKLTEFNDTHFVVKNAQQDIPLYIKKRKLKIKNIILVILIMIFISVSFQITHFLLDLRENKKKQKKLIAEVIEVIQEKEDKEEQFKVDFDKLKTINPETIGWIRYNQNKIDYPIVKTKNNSYYLKHAFDKSYNQAGAIFMDYRNISFDDQNVILFGHSMLDGTMFGSLSDVFQNGYFDKEENHYILIQNEENENLVYQIFSYYIIEKEEYYITPSFYNQNEFEIFIDTIKKRSIHNFDVEVSKDDKILTLSTCHGTGNTTKRKVIHAKRILSIE